MANESMTIGIALKMGSATGASGYAENHSVTTDANGVFRLKIGNGDAVSGAYNTIPWGSEATFVTVLVNGNEIGTTEMMAVPYALSSGDGCQTATEVPYNNIVSGLNASNAQEAIDELVGSREVDADADPTNEFQMLNFDVGTNELSLSDRNTVTIPSDGTDADADPTNEIQTISFDAASNEISLTDGGTITIPSGGTDADADPANEFQILSNDVGTNELSLSDGNSVIIPSGGTDADADPTNELQNLTLDGTTLEISGGTGVDLATIIPPRGGGTDDQNASEVPFDNSTSTLIATDTQGAIEELAARGLVDTDDQNLSLSGTLLQISDGTGVDLATIIPPGGTDDQNSGEVPYDNTVSALAATDTQAAIDELVIGSFTDTDDQNLTFDEITNILEIEDRNTVNISSLAGGGSSSVWTEDVNGVYRSASSVGIGTSPSPQTKLRIISGDEAIRDGIHSRIIHSGYKSAISASAEGHGNSYTFGTRSDTRGHSTGQAWAYRGAIGGAGTGTKFGLDLIFYDGTAGTKYGIHSRGEDRNYFSGDMGIGTDTPTAKLDVVGGIRSSDLSGSGQRNVIADANGNLVIGAAVGGSSLWTQDGSNINYTSGDVGIGTPDPTAKTHVLHNSNIATPQLKLEESEADYARLEFKNQAAGFWHIAGRGGDTGDVSRLNFYYHNGTVGRDYMTIAGSINVGIGTTAPTAKLDVNGNVNSSGEINRTPTGDANMVPIAHGRIDADGTKLSGTDNFTVSPLSSPGNYVIDLTDEGDNGEWVVVATPLSTVPRLPTIGYFPTFERRFSILICNMASIQVGSRFSFVVNKK